MIVEILRPARRASFLGLFGGPAPVAPTPEPGFEVYARGASAGGAVEVLKVDAESDRKVPAAMDGVLLRVRTAPQPVELSFSAALKDENGHGWDLTLRGSWSVADPPKFLTRYALDIASPEAPLAAAMAESWIAATVRPRLRDAVQGESVKELREKDKLPPRWWEAQLAKWLDGYGVAVKVAEATWESAAAARAEQERRAEADLARLAEAREREKEIRRKAEADAERYRQEKSRREDDEKIAGGEKAHGLNLLEIRRAKEVLLAQQEWEEARRAGDKVALQHAVAMAQVKNELQGVQAAKAAQEEADRKHGEALARIEEVRKVMEEQIAKLPENLLQQLASRNKEKAHQAAERIASPEFGISPKHLALLGYAVTPQSLAEFIRKKAEAGPPFVRLRKDDLRTRDIGTRKVKVQSMPINTSLRFEFTSERDGYVQLVNVGTSGSVYIQVPNAYADIALSKVVAGRPYAIPGSHLMPWDRLRECDLDYLEVGPTGWEHLAVIVSDLPMADPMALARSTRDNPFVKLTPDELELFGFMVENTDPESWSAGILSFLVG